MRKATMKDIAEQAGVSVATVSYIINNASNQSIPESTRVKVLQIAKEIGYVPNLAARSLIKNKTGLAGILINKTGMPSSRATFEQLAFISELERLLTAAGYHLIMFTFDGTDPASLNVITERKLDVVFLLDVMDDIFYTVSGNFGIGVPLILIDSLISDNLFKQVIYDYEAALSKAVEALDAPHCLFIEKSNNAGYMTYIEECATALRIPTYPYGNMDELDALLYAVAPYRQAIVMNEFTANHIRNKEIMEKLAVICSCGCPEMLRNDIIPITFASKAALAYSVMTKLLARDEQSILDEQTVFRVAVQ
ncbi:LacI family DNA-binding transcriptional regulator [Paenibacillus lignilyticus]|uniref:LacI family DNA-binding transcriptional regulator n=1 Tax=Paenibacillus lignilyticus TaxID=1172615 RepID=A0ABS5C5T5_9BACL|nr:LacI family DNA-binding transcriptional regulator [Paenibacillus lignilyticus]MBP3961357.1 LacI family DNA-binding transcriptional regulator [Paenibacillus lignilyticus]